MGYAFNKSFAKSWRPAYERSYAAAEAKDVAATKAGEERKTKLQELIEKQEEKTAKLQEQQDARDSLKTYATSQLKSKGADQQKIDELNSVIDNVEGEAQAINLIDKALQEYEPKDVISTTKQGIMGGTIDPTTLSPAQQKLAGVAESKSSVEKLEEQVYLMQLEKDNPEAYKVIMEARGRAGEAEVFQKGAEAAGSQKAKAQESLERDYYRVNATLDRGMDSAYKHGIRQLEITNTKPGEYLGIVDLVTPQQVNEYKAGWVGAGREGAATVGRFLIPGMRGLSATEIFSKSGAEIGNTIESNSFNVANSMGNAFSTALSNNIAVIDDRKDSVTYGKLVPIQTLAIDPNTGKPVQNLGTVQKQRAINDLSARHVVEQERHYLTQALKRDSRLLQKKTRVKLAEQAPNFNSEQAIINAVDSGRIMKGTLVKVNGKLAYANGSYRGDK